MKIGFDVSQTGSAKAGCGFYADGLIRQLVADDHLNSYVLYPAVGDFFWDPQYATATFRSDRPGLECWTPPGDLQSSRQFWRNPGHDFEQKIGAPDIFHANNFYCPKGLKRARLVYTLYDLSFLEDPSWNTEANRVGCFAGVFHASIDADFVVAISEFSRRHFLSTFPYFPANRVSVVYPASRFDGRGGFETPERFAWLKPEGFWLSVGTIEPRKNHSRLLDAYRILKAENEATLPIVLAGGQGWLLDHFDSFMHGLEAGRDVILPGYVSDEELRWLYRNCFGFIYPSLFEGFGMPVLEALGYGVPILCSNTSSLPEVAGDAALLFNPFDVESIAAAMRRMSDGSISRSVLQTVGERQAAKFSWSGSASRLRGIYDQVIDLPCSANVPEVATNVGAHD